MSNFWNTLPQPFFVLAPMEAVTDVVFRHVVARAGRPEVFFTEFTNATGWFRAGDKAIGGRLIKTEDEGPIVAQLWGSDPEAMAALSQHCATLGYDGIDINMGCPDQSAIKGGGGADMIRNPDRAAAIIAAAKTSGLPVSVKTRLGYTYIDEWREWLTFLLQQDIPALTIHLRTKKEMSKVPAHFELIGDIKVLRDEVAPHTKLIINGDILTRTQGNALAKEHGVDGIMIGRGIFMNPFCFADTGNKQLAIGNTLANSNDPINSRLHIANSSPIAHRQSLIDLLQFHLDQYDEYSAQTGRPFETLKRFFKIYIRDFDGASDLRDKLMHCTTTDEVRRVLNSAILNS